MSSHQSKKLRTTTTNGIDMAETISTADGDYRLHGSSRRNHYVDPGQEPGLVLPQVVTVTPVDDLQSALLERDARIAFLEKELIETRLQLAEKMSSEDRLKLELARARRDNGGIGGHVVSTSELSRVSAEEGEVVRIPLPPPASSFCDSSHTIERPRVVSTGDQSQQQAHVHQVEGTITTNFRMPLGQHLNASRPPRRTASYSRKRSNVLNSSGNSSSMGSECSWSNINPSSCASGLDLLAGDIPHRPSNTNFAGLNSQSSINRMLGGIGLTNSEHSLKKRRSGDVAAGQRRPLAGAAAPHYQRNEGWGDAVAMMAAQGPSHRRMPTAPAAGGAHPGMMAAQGPSHHRMPSAPTAGGNRSGIDLFANLFAASQGNMLPPSQAPPRATHGAANLLAASQGSMLPPPRRASGGFSSSYTSGSAQGLPSVFAMAAAGPPQENMFADLIRSNNTSRMAPALASTAEEVQRTTPSPDPHANNDLSGERRQED